MEMWVSAPGSIAGVAIVFGEFLTGFVGENGFGTPQMWGIAAIAIFAGINLLGVRWGGRTQIVLTSAKILGLLLLVAGALLLAEPASAVGEGSVAPVGLLDLFRLLGLGVAAVLFTYDGWTDVSHVAGEVVTPKRNLPWGLGLGVAGITGLYLIVNYAYLRVVSPEAMSSTVATTVAVRSFGPLGGQLVNGLIMLSVFGALGGLVMTAPRLVYAGASRYQRETRGTPAHVFFRPLSIVSRRTAVPTGSILFCAGLSVLTLIFFGTFGRLVTFILVPLQFTNILMVASVFPIRRRSGVGETTYLTPGFPVVPLVFIGVMVVFLVSAIIYDPIDTLMGVGMTASGVPVYLWINKRQRR
jgi:APA family basic amino acid/polyamine antiporter